MISAPLRTSEYPRKRLTISASQGDKLLRSSLKLLGDLSILVIVSFALQSPIIASVTKTILEVRAISNARTACCCNWTWALVNRGMSLLISSESSHGRMGDSRICFGINQGCIQRFMA